MYRGNLCSLESYRNIPFKLIDIVQVVKRKIQANSEVGTYSVIGDDVFYFIVEDKTKHFLESRAEIHDKYIDVQIVLEGKAIVLLHLIQLMKTILTKRMLLLAVISMMSSLLR